ncbi:MAG: hypothetical protein AAF614_28750, partial [Chloroflexota bacterium]
YHNALQAGARLVVTLLVSLGQSHAIAGLPASSVVSCSFVYLLILMNGIDRDSTLFYSVFAFVGSF